MKMTTLLSKYAKTRQFREEWLLFISFTHSKIREENWSENIYHYIVLIRKEVRKTMYAVIDMRTKRFVGLPCESLEEAIELRNQDEDNRSIFELGYVNTDEEEYYNDDVDETGFDPLMGQYTWEV